MSLRAYELPDTMTVKVPKDTETGHGWASPVTVTNVRYDRDVDYERNVSAAAPSGASFADLPKGRIFVHAQLSDGAFDIPVRSLVTIDGEELEVVASHRYRDTRGTMRHWELEVR